MNFIRNENFKNKLVLIRSDLNSDVVNKKVLESERIRESSKTIKFLKKQGAKIVVISHQGSRGKSDLVSLKKHSYFLNKYVKVKFIDDTFGKRAINKIKKIKSGEVLVLENLRFNKIEIDLKNKNKNFIDFIKLFDCYVNDAFSVCHREHASMIIPPKYLKSYAGLLLERELSALKKLKLKSKKIIYILGGAKPEENIRLLKQIKIKRNLLILTGGLFGQLCVISKGKDLGAQNKYLKNDIYITKKLRQYITKKVLMPVDFGVKVNNKRKDINLDDFPSNYEIYDIGPKTIEIFKKRIKDSNKDTIIYMKGPLGYCANKNFCKGTSSILKEISNSKSFSIIGGGHLNDAIRDSKIKINKFNHVSLSGGALLRYIAEEKLPGIIALENSKKN